MMLTTILLEGLYRFSTNDILFLGGLSRSQAGLVAPVQVKELAQAPFLCDII